MVSQAFQGLHTAVTTAVGNDLCPDVATSLAHWQGVLASGSHGICPFGTTGEGVAFSVSSRVALLEAAVGSGIPATSIMPVVGSNSIADAILLVSHANELGCRGVLVLPPSYYKNPSNDGVLEFYARLIDRTKDNNLRLFLYNIPQLTGIRIDNSMVDRLIEGFGPIIAGIKDSCGRLENTLAYIDAFPDMAVFTGTDHHIVAAMRAGGAGAVTGMGNINSPELRQIVDCFEIREFVERCRMAGEIHLIVERFGGVPAIKAIVAHYRNDPKWREMVPPLVALSARKSALLVSDLKAAGFAWAQQ